MSRRDDGSAVVDFVLVSVLVLALFLLVFQVGVFLHVRNVTAAAAAEGARYGATADRAPEDGAARAEAAVREALGDRGIHCRSQVVDVEGARALEVRCQGPVPVVFLPTPVVRVDVRGHALEEGP